jgi:hypothetical protein
MQEVPGAIDGVSLEVIGTQTTAQGRFPLEEASLELKAASCLEPGNATARDDDIYIHAIACLSPWAKVGAKSLGPGNLESARFPHGCGYSNFIGCVKRTGVHGFCHRDRN